MATSPTITQNGGPQPWWVWGRNITNREVFAFTLQSESPNIGALISDVSVFLNTEFVAGQVSYELHLSAVGELLQLAGHDDHRKCRK